MPDPVEQHLTERGAQLLTDPLLNKDTAFSRDERTAFELTGLIPPVVETIDQQLARVQDEYDRRTDDLQRYEYMRALQDLNETLFFAFLLHDLPAHMPIVYTPTVGEACERFSHLYRRPRGLFLCYPDADNLDQALANAWRSDIEVIVVTDGQRILGLGDLGANGMGIPIGKLALYTACGGIDPSKTLPIVLDVGTDNDDKRNDPEYIGWRHERVKGDDYDAFVEKFVTAVEKAFPDVLLQFEDFALEHAHALLDRYCDRLCCFNDDIQGTAAVTVGALLSAVRMSGADITDQRVVIVGAGSAGSGIAELVISAMVNGGLAEDEARSRLYIVDVRGLLTDDMVDLRPFQQPLVQKRSALADWTLTEPASISLAEVVANAKPTAMVGVTGVPGLFTEEIVRSMAAGVDRPIIFPLSNPTDRAEATASDVVAWTDGAALVATGSPFDPVEHAGTTYTIAQCNNSYIFPGMGLAVRGSGANRVTDAMFMAAATALAEHADPAAATGSSILPALDGIRDVSRAIAIAVATQAQADGHAPASSPGDLEAAIDATMWTPEYHPYHPAD